MYEHISYHTNWASIIEEEINADNEEWFSPKGQPGNNSVIGDFDYGKLKFINRNLNYFYFNNMIAHAIKNDYSYNPNYKNTLEFCNSIRDTIGETGPFGRMCIWKLEPRSYLLPHVDNWDYHTQIRRYIFCVSNHQGSEALINIKNVTIDVQPGLLFSFNPASEEHEFKNNTNRPWFFIGFDFWIPDKLENVAALANITKQSSIEYVGGFGGFNKKTRYMSKE